MPDHTEADIDADFASAMRRSGVTLDADRLPGMRESYLRYLEFVRVLDEPLSYTDEPAIALHLQPTLVKA
ncbi:hypothetical protein [Acidisphaera sp. L21]|jgi:hypothetical protein|uniref:hypothetical protein n=1 Tax=Acidisphaera sp. L21 TaxID=1641851 RepID=UPI00131D6EBE|nr:hypothetical protein [Acidisphaera sp. L21]